MIWLYIVIISHFLFGIVFAIDKIVIGRFISPFWYALIIGILEGLVIFLAPFVNFIFPSFDIFILALFSGAGFIFGLYFYFKALERHEATWVAPMVFGVFIPIASFFLNYFFLSERLSLYQIAAFIFLVLGGLILSISSNQRAKIDLKSKCVIFGLMLASSIFLSLELTLVKIIFESTNFISGYIISRFGGFLIAILISAFIFTPTPTQVWGFIPRYRTFGKILIFKQILSALANFLLFYAVFLSSPTLVNATGGLRYVFLLIIAIFLSYKWPKLLEERMNWKIILKKIAAVLFILIGLILLTFKPYLPRGAKIWGVTYSSFYAKQLGYDPEKLFKIILKELNVKDVRLVAYWPEIEPRRDFYDFSVLDSQINELKNAGGKTILTLGMRVPRWPECHIPKWIEKETLSIQRERLMKYIIETVIRYKNNPAVWAWQVENEPFLGHFGECPKTDPAFLDEEIRLVKFIDNTRPIIISDSGELGRWQKAYKRADIFGTTMYRVIWTKYTGYFTYPLKPSFFHFKAGLTQSLSGEKEIINIELQAEPWLEKRPWETALVEQIKSFPVSQLKENIEYAKEVGFEKNYLWGVEWWYWLKDKYHDSDYWDEAKKLF